MSAKTFYSLVFATVSVSAFAQFTGGNLAVLRVGDGTQLLSNNGNSVFVDQYTTVGSYVNSVVVPSSGASSVVQGGNRTAEGWLALSADNRYLTFAGYNSLPGAANVQSADGVTVPRVVGQIDMLGNFSIPISSTTAYSAQSFRSAVTDGSGNYWGFGSGSSAAGNGGYYLGAGPQAILQPTYTTLRAAGIFNGNVYFSHTGSTNTGPGIYGFSGFPTAAATPTLLFSTGPSAGTDEFVINSAGNIAYVADDRAATSGGGVQKWMFDGVNWALSYTIATGSPNGARGLAVDFSGIAPVVYATTGESSAVTANKIVSFVDTGANSTVSVIATAAGNEVFRGLEFIPVPEPSSAALLGLATVGWLLRRRNS